MKKQKVNLKKLSLHKNKVSALNGNQVVGGAPASLHCGTGSVILNCAIATIYNPPNTIPISECNPTICEAVQNSKETYCFSCDDGPIPIKP